MSQTASSSSNNLIYQGLPSIHPFSPYYPPKSNRECALLRLRRKEAKARRRESDPSSHHGFQSRSTPSSDLRQTIAHLQGQVLKIASTVENIAMALQSAIESLTESQAATQATTVKCFTSLFALYPTLESSQSTTPLFSGTDIHPFTTNSNSGHPSTHILAKHCSSSPSSSSAGTPANEVHPPPSQSTSPMASALPALRGCFANKEANASSPETRSHVSKRSATPSSGPCCRKKKKGITSALPGLRGRLL